TSWAQRTVDPTLRPPEITLLDFLYGEWGVNTKNIIRAWKDEEYRLSLSAAERALLPDNPAGLIELTDTDLEQIAGEAPNSYFSCGSTLIFDCRSTSYNCFTIACRGV